MEAMLLAAVLSCADGAWILSGVVDSPVLDQMQRTEIIFEILQVMPDNCSEEEYNPSGRK